MIKVGERYNTVAHATFYIFLTFSNLVAITYILLLVNRNFHFISFKPHTHYRHCTILQG